TQRRGDAHDQKHSRAILRALSVLDQSKQKRHIQPKGKQHAFESLFFSPRGHDEIRVADGDVAQLILTAVAKSFAPETAGTDGNLGLQHLITGTLCVFFGVHEGRHALPLVRFQDVAADRGIKNAAYSQYSHSEIIAACCHCRPARNAPTTSIGNSTRAVPRSGCFRINTSGSPTKNPALIKSCRESSSLLTSAKKRATTMIIINFTNSDT